MTKELQVHADEVFATSHNVCNDAEELREELAAITREWASVSHGWAGTAATAYEAMWQEWQEGATTLVDVLAEMSEKLARAAVAYQEQDTQSAEVLDSTPVDLGL